MCYEHFRNSLVPVFAAAHAGGQSHVGKQPKRKDDGNLEILQLKLKAAIEKEAYEEAGEIKKKIDLLKAQQLLE